MKQASHSKPPVVYDSIYYEIPSIGIFIETEYRFMIAKVWGGKNADC